RALLHEADGCRVAPAALAHKAVENLDVFRVRLAPVLKTPLENFLIGAALEHARGERIEFHAEQLAHTVVERPLARDHADIVARRKSALRVQADLVEDATEDKNPADGIARRADGKGHAAG